MEYLFITPILFRSSEVLQEVEGMREYQENIENLNEVAHNRPRAHLVLGRVRKLSHTKPQNKKQSVLYRCEVSLFLSTSQFQKSILSSIFYILVFLFFYL